MLEKEKWKQHTYEDYENLCHYLREAEKYLKEENFIKAEEALKHLSSKALSMWHPMLAPASATGNLLADIEKRRFNPPYSDFTQRLQEIRTYYLKEYEADKRKHRILLGNAFVPADTPDPPC